MPHGLLLKHGAPPARPNTPCRRVLRGESGFSLVEVLVATLLLGLVMGALMTPMLTTARVQTNDATYAYSQQQARTALDGIVSQIRQAWAILATTPNSVEMNVNLSGVAMLVYYDCTVPQPGSSSYRECVRVQAPAGSSLPPLSSGTVVAKNLTNGTTSDPVFSFAPDPVAPYYMTATVKVPASGASNSGLQHVIAFSNGALMRNENVGN